MIISLSVLMHKAYFSPKQKFTQSSNVTLVLNLKKINHLIKEEVVEKLNCMIMFVTCVSVS